MSWIGYPRKGPWVKKVSAGGDSRELRFMSGEKGRIKQKRQDLEPVTTVGNWP